jgi:hypothetical protein
VAVPILKCKAVSPVENLALVENDRFHQTPEPDVVGEFPKLRTAQQGKGQAGGVEGLGFPEWFHGGLAPGVAAILPPAIPWVPATSWYSSGSAPVEKPCRPRKNPGGGYFFRTLSGEFSAYLGERGSASS